MRKRSLLREDLRRVLEQPSGARAHTLSKSFTAGTMHPVAFVDSFVSVLERSIAECDSDHVTNQEPALEFIGKVKKILQPWRQQRPRPYT